MLATIGLIIDVVIVCALVISAIIGYKKGFLKSVLAFFSWAVCIFVAIFAARYVANWVNHIYNFDGLIGGGIAKGLIKNNEYFATLATNYLPENMPSGLGFLGQLTKVVFNNINGNFAEDETIASVVGRSVGHICMIIICALLIFIILKIVLLIINKIIDKITKTKVIGVINKIFGAIFGFLKAMCIIIVFNVVLSFLTLIPAVNKTVKPLIRENTYIERVIYTTTDKVVENKVVNGDMIKNWLSNMWDNKNS